MGSLPFDQGKDEDMCKSYLILIQSMETQKDYLIKSVNYGFSQSLKIFEKIYCYQKIIILQRKYKFNYYNLVVF